jgi:hypothetical protein
METLRSHWVWLAAILTVWSAWDYYEHISRPGSAFEQAPGAWFAFSFATLASVLVIARTTAWLIGRHTPLPELPAATIGIMVAVAAHLRITGPLWDRVLWDGGLIFNGVAIPVLIAATLYLVFRALFALYARVLGSQPPSRA